MAAFDTGIAIWAGVIIIPVLFFAGAKQSRGARLVFVVLPTMIQRHALWTDRRCFVLLPFAVLFFFLLAIVALTPTISLLEVAVS